MGRPKGQPKTGGRKKGTPNKKDKLGGFDTLAKLVEAMEDPSWHTFDRNTAVLSLTATLRWATRLRKRCEA